MTKPSFVAMGDVAWDFLVKPGRELIWGSDVSGDVQLQPGGVAANFAVWASRMGAQVRLCGKIGDDLLGQFARDNLRRAGVEEALIAVPGTRTACYGVLVRQDGARAFIQDKDPRLSFRLGDVSTALLDGAGLLYFTGYTAYSPGAAEFLRPLLDEARERKVQLAFDAGSFQLLADYTPDRLWQEIGSVDFLFANEDETRVLCQAAGGDARSLLAHARQVILKRGARGAGYLDQTEELCLPGAIAAVVDTTGAGDAFNAAFLLEFFGGRGPRDSLKRAIAVGAQLVGVLGSQPLLDMIR